MLKQVFNNLGVQHHPPPSLDLNFLSGALDSRITASGGANGYVVGPSGLLVPATTPRFDYDPITLACKGLLVEEQRTNLLTQSGDISNAAWTKFTATATGGQTASPDGGANGTKLVANAGSAGYAVQGTAHTSGTTYTQSVFVKPAGRTVFSLVAQAGLFTDATARAFNYTLTGNGSAAVVTGTGASATITSVANGWYYCTLTYTPSVTTSSGVQLRDSTAGDGANGFYLWGAQLEAGSFATSYIPTTSAQVTRTGDLAVMTGTNFSSWFNAAQGTLYVEGDSASFNAGTVRPLFAIEDGVNANTLRTYFRSGASGLGFEVRAASTTQAFPLSPTGLLANTVYKTAGAYAPNDVNAAFSGTLGVGVSSLTMPTGMDRMNIGVAAGGAYLNGHVRRLRFYPTRLPNAQLQAMTT